MDTEDFMVKFSCPALKYKLYFIRTIHGFRHPLGCLRTYPLWMGGAGKLLYVSLFAPRLRYIILFNTHYSFVSQVLLFVVFAY